MRSLWEVEYVLITSEPSDTDSFQLHPAHIQVQKMRIRFTDLSWKKIELFLKYISWLFGHFGVELDN